LDQQSEETCLWIRERFLRASPRHFEMHVVHGHSPAWDERTQSCEPELLSHRTNLDLATYLTDSLAVGVFDSAIEGGPIEILIAHGSHGTCIQVTSRVPAATVPRSKRRLGWQR
jgi:hypothetical protein